VYELCTSGGFSGPIRHFRPLNTLQLTHSALVTVIVVRAHAGEPSLVFKRLQNCVYELCTNADLTSPFILFSFQTALIQTCQRIRLGFLSGQLAKFEAAREDESATRAGKACWKGLWGVFKMRGHA